MADISSLIGAAGLGGAIGKAVVFLELETTKYQAELKAMQTQTVAATTGSGAAVSKYAGLAKLGFAAVGVAAVAGAAVAVKAAVDLNEQINKTKEVFKDSADDILAWSKTTASAFGVSETSALTAAGAFGQIFDAAGLAESQTSSMSKSLVELAADLSSFNNIDPTVSLEKLQAGLAGQARPLREVGVFLSAARVEAEAYGSGIAKVGEELTDAQKIQARYNLILEDTEKAQGDFARTLGESIPNQMRVLKAELEDTAAKLGQAFLPLVLEAAKALLDMVDALGPLLDLLGKLGPVVGFVASAFEKLVSPLATVITLISQGIKPTDEMTQVIGDAALNLQSMKAKAEIAAAELQGLTSDTKKTGDAVKKTTDDVEDFILSLDETAEQTIITRKEFIDSTRVMQREADQLDKALREIAKGAKEGWINPDYVKFLSDQGPAWLIGFADLTVKQQHIAQGAWEESTKKTDKANESLERITGVLDRLDKGESKHVVEIEYRYTGFDPSKPGMSGSAQQR